MAFRKLRTRTFDIFLLRITNNSYSYFATTLKSSADVWQHFTFFCNKLDFSQSIFKMVKPRLNYSAFALNLFMTVASSPTLDSTFLPPFDGFPLPTFLLPFHGESGSNHASHAVNHLFTSCWLIAWGYFSVHF